MGQTGGTSAAAPVVAGIIALLNDARLRAGKPTMGFINPFLYSLGPGPIADITAGKAVGCNGYNMQTGGLSKSFLRSHHSSRKRLSLRGLQLCSPPMLCSKLRVHLRGVLNTAIANTGCSSTGWRENTMGILEWDFGMGSRHWHGDP